MEIALYIIAVIIAYLIGNISPAIILGKIKGVDIKKEGSGNAGTTNVLRVLGKKYAVITLVVDILKGVLAVALSYFILAYYPVVATCAVAVFIGHVWPVFHKFKGGKGVATAFGAALAINWQLALIALGVAALGLLISKRMSVGSILAAISFGVLSWFMAPDFFWYALVIVAIILFKHRANIVRLCKGEEPKMSFKK